ncbi:MAG TPA: hypothetical protein VN025_18945 [Candidatus Dormibacteraeota bacterium]|jgi:hypothetical protein|nr:hypothetical protein [Candidatus Dormibacteraeota bacterium]
MSTDRHTSDNGNLPVNNDVSFETRDISISAVVWSLFYLAVTVFVSLAICVYFFKFSTGFVAGSDTPRPMIRQQMSATDEMNMSMPPEPRLQGVPGHITDPQQDMRTKVAEDSKANESYGWVDEKNGIAQIPVSEAMKIIAEKGLPGAAAAAPEKKQ